MGIIFAAVLFLFVAISVVWSVFVRKMVKTRIKSIFVIASVILALIGTVVVKNTVLDSAFIDGTLMPLLAPMLPAEVSELVNSSAVLREVVMGLPVALISPLIFVVLYVVLSILLGIVYLFVLLFAGRSLKNSEKNDGSAAKAQSIIWSVCSAVLALVVILAPIAFYGSLVDDTLSALSETNVMDAETKALVDGINNEYVSPITNGAVVQVFRVFGGDALVDELTSFPLKGETIYLRKEFGVLANVVGDIMPLTAAQGEFGEAEANSIVSAVNSLTNSKFLMAIASEAVYVLTDDMVNGEADMIMGDNELVGDLVSQTITIVHDDAMNTQLFAADLKTVAQMVSELIKSGVLSNMGDIDALLEGLAGGNTIKNIILALGKNNSMKCLIPEVTNIGVKAIASAIGIKADANEAYNDLLNNLAADLNSVMNIDDGEQQVSELSEKLTKTFDHAGLVVAKEDINSYAAAMIETILGNKNGSEVTAQEVQDFFVTSTAANVLPVRNVEEYEKNTLLVFLDDIAVDVEEATQKITDATVEQEATAIGGIFTQAGSLVNAFSGNIVISDMADSVGGILNSMSQSVCVGPTRTANLFVAIVQSSMVRDAANNMDIKTATDLGTSGSGGDYAKTFKTISNTMDVLQNMNSSEGLTAEHIETMIKDITPESAGMIGSYITEDRLTEEYGMNKEQSEIAAPLISDVFGYIGKEGLSEDQRKEEAQAITDVMNLVTNASDRANSSEAPAQSLFGGEDENSVLGKTADETIETIMASGAIKESLNNNADKLAEGGLFGTKTEEGGEEVTQSVLTDTEKGQLVGAMEKYYTETSNEETKAKDAEALANIGKLFGLSESEMSFLPPDLFTK